MKKIAKFFISLLVFVLCFIPTWIYLLARVAFEPQGFWQNIFLFGIGLYFLGFAQFILFIVFVVLIIVIIQK
jgi:RsiW-degrading membrane proteinase PrsW (M82 family)